MTFKHVWLPKLNHETINNEDRSSVRKEQLTHNLKTKKGLGQDGFVAEFF